MTQTPREHNGYYQVGIYYCITATTIFGYVRINATTSNTQDLKHVKAPVHLR